MLVKHKDICAIVNPRGTRKDTMLPISQRHQAYVTDADRLSKYPVKARCPDHDVDYVEAGRCKRT